MNDPYRKDYSDPCIILFVIRHMKTKKAYVRHPMGV